MYFSASVKSDENNLVLYKNQETDIQMQASKNFYERAQTWEKVVKIIPEKIDLIPPCLTNRFESENLQTTKLAVKDIFQIFLPLYKEVTGEEFASEDIKPLQQFVDNFEMTEEDWSERQSQVELCSKVETFMMNWGIKLNEWAIMKNSFSQLINTHNSIFSGEEKNITDDHSWIYFPLINPHSEKEEMQVSEKSDDWQSMFFALRDGRCRKGSYRNGEYGCTSYSKQPLEGEAPLSELLNNALSGEYKIHLMPKGEFVFSTTEKLLESIASDLELKECISTFKISRYPSAKQDSSGKVVPVIVIYPKLSKGHAQTVLNRIMHHFEPHLSWGTGQCPRYNRAGKNPLVFYSQGDSMQKKQFKELTDCSFNEDEKVNFSDLYDEEGIHYNASFGDFLLELPPNF